MQNAGVGVSHSLKITQPKSAAEVKKCHHQKRSGRLRKDRLMRGGRGRDGVKRINPTSGESWSNGIVRWSIGI